MSGERNESGYSDIYQATRRKMKNWSQWKIDVYNASYATSAHARKIERSPAASEYKEIHMNEKIKMMDVIENALALAGYDIMDIKGSTMLVRNAEQDRTFSVTIADEAD